MSKCHPPSLRPISDLALALAWQFSVAPVRVGPGHIQGEAPQHPPKAVPEGHGAVARDEEAKPMSRTQLPTG